MAARNAVDIVQTLLRQRHDPNERDRYGLTPLMWAARAGAVDAMTALLDAGADPNARGGANDWTPLLHAIHKGRAAAVRLLLDRGVDPEPTRGDAHTARHGRRRSRSGHRPAAAGPRRRRPRRGIGGSTALTVAVSGGALTDLDRPIFGGCHPDTVRALLAHDPTLRLPDTIAGREALWWARFHGCAEVLSLVGGEKG